MNKTLVAMALLCGSTVALGQDEGALSATNGLASQKYMGVGKGVIVSVLDSGVDVTHPALRNSVYLQ